MCRTTAMLCGPALSMKLLAVQGITGTVDTLCRMPPHGVVLLPPVIRPQLLDGTRG